MAKSKTTAPRKVGGASHKVGRMKGLDEKKGKSKPVKTTIAALGTPWALQDPSKLPTIQHK